MCGLLGLCDEWGPSSSPAATRAGAGQGPPQLSLAGGAQGEGAAGAATGFVGGFLKVLGFRGKLWDTQYHYCPRQREAGLWPARPLPSRVLDSPGLGERTGDFSLQPPPLKTDANK